MPSRGELTVEIERLPEGDREAIHQAVSRGRPVEEAHLAPLAARWAVARRQHVALLCFGIQIPRGLRDGRAAMEAYIERVAASPVRFGVGQWGGQTAVWTQRSSLVVVRSGTGQWITALTDGRGGALSAPWF